MMPLNRLNKARKEQIEVRDSLIANEVVCDIVNGLSKADILEKLQAGVYLHSEGPISLTTSYRYWNKALARIKVDSEYSMAEKREVLWSRYENLYKESLEQGNAMNARQCLNDMAKIFGLSEPEKKEVTLKELTVDFGFIKGENEG